MRITHPVEAKFIELEVKGKEKVSFTVGGNDNIKVKDKKEIIHYSQPCFTF